MSTEESHPIGLAVPTGLKARGEIRVPSSKSATHRCFNLALLSRRSMRVEHPLLAEDTELFLDVLANIGFQVEKREGLVALTPGPLPPNATFDCGNAGTLFRFLVASLTTQVGEWIVDGSLRLRERPIRPLVDALRTLGARIDYLQAEGFAPLRIEGGTLNGGRVRLDAGESSQYLSALLMAGLRAREETLVEVGALTSAPYVALTLEVVRAFGGVVEPRTPGGYRIYPGLSTPETFEVEGDFSAACYPAAAAALTGGVVRLYGLRPGSAQGDRAFLELLRIMGARLAWGEDALEVGGTGSLRALELDMSSMPDQVPTMAALAPFALGTTRITNVAHLRIKESDRLAAMASELTKAGAEVYEGSGRLTIPGLWGIDPPPSTPVLLRTYQDHRIAMSLALLGLRRPGVRIDEPKVVGKSYPNFWSDLANLLEGSLGAASG